MRLTIHYLCEPLPLPPPGAWPDPLWRCVHAKTIDRALQSNHQTIKYHKRMAETFQVPWRSDSYTFKHFWHIYTHRRARLVPLQIVVTCCTAWFAHLMISAANVTDFYLNPSNRSCTFTNMHDHIPSLYFSVFMVFCSFSLSMFYWAFGFSVLFL